MSLEDIRVVEELYLLNRKLCVAIRKLYTVNRKMVWNNRKSSITNRNIYFDNRKFTNKNPFSKKRKGDRSITTNLALQP